VSQPQDRNAHGPRRTGAEAIEILGNPFHRADELNRPQRQSGLIVFRFLFQYLLDRLFLIGQTPRYEILLKA